MLMKDYGPLFLRNRMDGFRKDMRICLTGVPRALGDRRPTHAYFPAVAICCATLEFLAGFHSGKGESESPIPLDDIKEFARLFMPPSYNDELIHVLHKLLRHKTAHQGIATGVWIQKGGTGAGNRVIWRLTASYKHPGCRIEADAGELDRHTDPWKCRYTHRFHVNLGRLWCDLHQAAARYSAALHMDSQLQDNFERCMRRLYPV